MIYTIPEDQSITLLDMDVVREQLTDEQKKDIDRKWREISGLVKYGTREIYLAAKDAFTHGYIAMLIRYEDDPENWPKPSCTTRFGY